VSPCSRASWSRYGSYQTGATFVDGMLPALWIGAAVVLLGALAAFLIPRRSHAPEAQASADVAYTEAA
jgi:hypothetical protein